MTPSAFTLLFTIVPHHPLPVSYTHLDVYKRQDQRLGQSTRNGGLADVAGALPKALVRDGIDARVVMPLYGDLKLDVYKRQM